MCDLWKNTIDTTTVPGTIPKQIEYALERLPSVRQIKLYNSGNFFDKKAIPTQDYDGIADILAGFETVIIENHPKFINQTALEFRDKINANLQVAIGLETVHPKVLPLLNKQMTLEDFSGSVQFLKENDIFTRAFILLRPPFLDENEGIIWAKKSIDFAFEEGVECCVVIPTRSGNGALNKLKTDGYFHSPRIRSIEEVLEYGISLDKGRVFADLWDVKQFSECEICVDLRVSRMNRMNLDQNFIDKVKCSCTEDCNS
jgi:radical SAM enzyme (TIGR01210 family)